MYQGISCPRVLFGLSGQSLMLQRTVLGHTGAAHLSNSMKLYETDMPTVSHSITYLIYSTHYIYLYICTV